jgi:hypothetical protein
MGQQSSVDSVIILTFRKFVIEGMMVISSCPVAVFYCHVVVRQWGF